jgi:predicted ATPase
MSKTRLSSRAHALRAVFADGVWMVSLAPIADPDLVPATVAQALGVTLPGHNGEQDEVVDVLRKRELLLVLDDREHVVHAARRFVDAVLKVTARVKVLVTSQESVKVGAEHVYRASTLTVPATLELGAARSSSAVALFVARVHAVQPAFALTDRNLADVLEICRQLDGLALTIELAATRVPLLGVVGVRNSLHERFRMLTGGARLADRRHQTLHEMLDWSHGLLTLEERLIFRRVGVFAGSFSMQAAQKFLADDQFDEWAVLNQLGSLVDKSLIVAEVLEPPRYRLLESTRAYALERLREAGETSAWQLSHARVVLAMFEASHEQQALSTSERHGLQLPDVDNRRRPCPTFSPVCGGISA